MIGAVEAVGGDGVSGMWDFNEHSYEGCDDKNEVMMTETRRVYKHESQDLRNQKIQMKDWSSAIR